MTEGPTPDADKAGILGSPAPAIGLHDWFATPPGRYLLAWERERLDALVADVFGYHALQLGMPALDALRTNRMPHRWRATANPVDVVAPDPIDEPAPPDAAQPAALALVADFTALPFPENSIDLVVLPHTLELSDDPHAALREVHRVLVPEGKLVVCGLNPASLWGLRQWRSRFWGRRYLPEAGEFIGERRLRDWLRLLNFELEASTYGCWRPAVRSQPWLERTAWMDGLGARWWPIFGAAYCLVAAKRVHGMRLLTPWKARAARSPATAPVSIAGRAIPMRSAGQEDPENKTP